MIIWKMSQFAAEPQRPTMRRKSSAQNLLSSFKSASSSAGPSSSAAQQQAPSSISSQTTLVYQPQSAVASTPTASTPMAREWDAQSLHSDTVAASTPAISQGTSVEYLRDLVQKRIITLTYVRNIHEGCVASFVPLMYRGLIRHRRSHWFHTIMISRAELDREFNNHDMKKR